MARYEVGPVHYPALGSPQHPSDPFGGAVQGM